MVIKEKFAHRFVHNPLMARKFICTYVNILLSSLCTPMLQVCTITYIHTQHVQTKIWQQHIIQIQDALQMLQKQCKVVLNSSFATKGLVIDDAN